ncbi:gastrula zinc finger protein XlCGF9.1 [Folsomia candida]|uniref:C2H2-type domain-containing protein n=1 Tax=Folsomia candida TaxID=158441 RepID=A0A226DNJ5_FOLCA|nr:gastrula zinc finger protein XlCGF9.1 [Folsomia candida]OXA45796.1 hypothetical protein Fcan01_19438 [Folsomia candida]
MFSSKQNLTNHRFAHLSEDEKVALVKQGTSRACLFCQKKFPDNGAYHAHLVSHTKEKPFPCYQCGALFGSHKKTVHEKRKDFACPECAKKFGRKGDMVEHVKSDHLKRRHPCPHCGKTDVGRHLRKLHPPEVCHLSTDPS